MDPITVYCDDVIRYVITRFLRARPGVGGRLGVGTLGIVSVCVVVDSIISVYVGWPATLTVLHGDLLEASVHFTRPTPEVAHAYFHAVVFCRQLVCEQVRSELYYLYLNR